MAQLITTCIHIYWNHYKVLYTIWLDTIHTMAQLITTCMEDNLPLGECPSPAKNVTIILLYPFKRIEVEHDKTALYLCIYSAE